MSSLDFDEHSTNHVKVRHLPAQLVTLCEQMVTNFFISCHRRACLFLRKRSSLVVYKGYGNLTFVPNGSIGLQNEYQYALFL